MKKIMSLAGLLIAVSLLPALTNAQQDAAAQMPAPQEMMMRQMAIRAHQYQADNIHDDSDLKQQKNTPFKQGQHLQAFGMSMMGPNSFGPTAKGGMMGKQLSQMRKAMMGTSVGPGMMPANIMAYPMMGFASDQEREDLAIYEKFINETRELRRTLHNNRFDFKEAFWVPETTLKELREMAEEITRLQQKIDSQKPNAMKEKE